MADPAHLACDDQAVFDRICPAFLQVVQHDILVVDADRLFLVLRMYILADASPAFGKEITAGGRHIQFFVIIGRGDLAVGIVLSIDVIQRIVLFRERCGNLVVDFLLARDSAFADLPAVLRFIVQEADDQAGSFVFFNDGGPQPDVAGCAFHDDAVIQDKKAAAFNFRKDILFCKSG